MAETPNPGSDEARRRPPRLPSAVRAAVTEVESESDGSTARWRITVTRSALLTRELEPHADDVPADVRRALLAWLGVESP